MSDTRKAEVRHPHRRESPANRRVSRRVVRHATRAALRAGQPDEAPRYRGTEGWLTH